MVMLVALRLVIGWHFFKEGLSHRTDPNWTSGPFLEHARGPLADHYHAVLPKFHQWNRLMVAPLVDTSSLSKDEAPEDASALKSDKEKAVKPPPISDEWLKEVGKDWKTDQDAFAAAYNLDANQKDQAADVLKQSLKQMEDSLKDNVENIRLYRLLVYRAQMMQATPVGSEIPFIKNRAATVQTDPLGEAGVTAAVSAPPPAWKADAIGVEKLYHDRLADLLTDDQRKLGELPSETSKLHKIDTVVSWAVLISGGCLIVGLFTRLAALTGAAFLLSVICAQPPWLADSMQTQTYYQGVEMFALLALATTAVGHWGGLDYFIHLLVRPCCAAKGKKA